MTASTSRLTVCILAVFLASALPALAQEDNPCADCHEDAAVSMQTTVHGNLPDRWQSANTCTSCHGDNADQHMDSGGDQPMFRFDDPEADPGSKAAKCLGCHAERQGTSHYMESEHAKGGVVCSDCHQVHPASPGDRLAVRDDTVRRCQKCHQEIAPQTALNERHRLHENMVQCTDCHVTHEPSPRSQLGGFKSETCFKCHTDKQGPFVFEHASGLVEGCAACHDPHGSVNRHMLTYQNVAELCYSCHIQVPGFHSRFTAYSQCTNCHATIHGSNVHEAFLN